MKTNDLIKSRDPPERRQQDGHRVADRAGLWGSVILSADRSTGSHD